MAKILSILLYLVVIFGTMMIAEGHNSFHSSIIEPQGYSENQIREQRSQLSSGAYFREKRDQTQAKIEACRGGNASCQQYCRNSRFYEDGVCRYENGYMICKCRVYVH